MDFALDHLCVLTFDCRVPRWFRYIVCAVAAAIWLFRGGRWSFDLLRLPENIAWDDEEPEHA